MKLSEILSSEIPSLSFEVFPPKTDSSFDSVKTAVEEIAEEPIVIPYDNGGVQKGIRQNPYFQGYEALWKAYMAGMGQIMSAADTKKDSKVTKLKPNSVIAMVRSGQKQA